MFLGLNCTPPAIDDFPSDLLTEDQRREGAVLIHILISLYLFVALAVVCDNYFVPAVEKICHGKSSNVLLKDIKNLKLSYLILLN